MGVFASIYNFLGVKPDERKAISFLILYSFALGLATAFFYTPASSLFLQKYSRQQLPVGYILGGILVFLLGLFVKRQQRRMKLSKLFRLLLVFLLISTSTLVLLYFFVPALSDIMIFIFFAWIRVYLYILAVSFWGLAGRLFNVRQAKRVFSLIGAGEVISYIISFFSIPFILQIPFIDTPTLLFVSLFGLLATLFFGTFIIKKFQDKLDRTGQEKKKGAHDIKAVKPSKNYFKLIYIMAVFPILSVIFVEFLFFAKSQIVFKGQGETLSGFLAIFFGFTAIVEFLVKTFLSGKMVERFGLMLGLIALPAMLAFSFLVVSLSGFIPLAAALFFPALALSRMFLRAFRTSFYDPSFQVLYQPIPETERVGFQNQIEGGIKSYGNIISGFLLLGLMYLSFLDLEHIAYIFFVLTTLWIWFTIKMHHSYRFNLNNLLTATSDRSKKQDVNQEAAETVEVKDYHFALSYFQDADYSKFRSVLETALLAPDKPTQELALIFAEVNLDPEILSLLKNNLKDKRKIDEIEKRFQLELVFWEEAMMANNIQLRLTAASMLGSSRRYSAYKPLLKLMRDENPVVARAAIRAAAKLKRFELWPFLFENLKQRDRLLPTVEAIFSQNPAVVNELIVFLQKTDPEPILVRLLIPKLQKHQTDSTVLYLRSKVLDEDYTIRNLALKTLSVWNIKINRRDRAQLFQLLENEIKAVVKIAHIIKDLQKPIFDKLNELLLNDIQDKRDNIFLLLYLMYDANVIALIRENLEKDSAEAKSFAVEILDITVEEDIKLLVLPVMEIYEPEEIIIKYKNQFSFVHQPEVERLQELINIGFFQIDSFTRFLALDLIGKLYAEESVIMLKATVPHPNPLFAEKAQEILAITEQGKIQKRHLTKLRLMKKIELFKDLPFEALNELVLHAELYRTEQHIQLWDAFVFVLSGEIVLEEKHFKVGTSHIVKSNGNFNLKPTSESEFIVLNANEIYLTLHFHPEFFETWEKEIIVHQLPQNFKSNPT